MPIQCIGTYILLYNSRPIALTHRYVWIDTYIKSQLRVINRQQYLHLPRKAYKDDKNIYVHVDLRLKG